MTITAAKARELSAESIENFKKSKFFSDIIDRLEELIKNAADTGNQSVTCPAGVQTKANGDRFSKSEWQAVVDELIANGFRYVEHTEKNCAFYTVSW